MPAADLAVEEALELDVAAAAEAHRRAAEAAALGLGALGDAAAADDAPRGTPDLPAEPGRGPCRGR